MVNLLPTLFFPPAIWYTLAQQKTSVIDVNEHYQKQTLRNRCQILTASGMQNLTVPVRLETKPTPTQLVPIDNRANWQRLHKRALETSYSRAPYFEFFIDVAAPWFATPFASLGQVQRCAQSILSELLPQLAATHNLAKPKGEAYQFSTRIEFKPGAKGLWPHTHTTIPTYTQIFADRMPFIPHLSVIDVFMHLGPSTVDYINSLAAINVSNPMDR